MIEQLAGERGFEIAGRVDHDRPEWTAADVAIDFSTADALLANFDQYVQRRIPAVIGTTGWGEHAGRPAGCAPRPSATAWASSRRPTFRSASTSFNWWWRRPRG
jgi:hypothetical protein